MEDEVDKPYVAGRLTLYETQTWTTEGRVAIANWLAAVAQRLVSSDPLASNFTAVYEVYKGAPAPPVTYHEEGQAKPVAAE